MVSTNLLTFWKLTVDICNRSTPSTFKDSPLCLFGDPPTNNECSIVVTFIKFKSKNSHIFVTPLIGMDDWRNVNDGVVPSRKDALDF